MNPSPWWFPIGREVGPQDLVGREPFLADIVARAGLGESLAISSPRRTGKTSVVREALRRLSGDGWLTAFVDLLRHPSEARLAEALTDAVLQNETGLHRTLERLRGAAATAASLMQLSTKTDAGLEFALRFRTAAPTLEEALEAGEGLAQRLGRRIVVAFDEFQTATAIRADLYGFMRSILQRHQQAVYLFLGSQAGLLEQQFTRPHTPFFKFAIVRPLPGVPAEAWVGYLHDRYREAGRAVSAEFCRALVERTGGHPHCTMVVANKVLMVGSLQAGIPEAALLELAYAAGLEDLAATYDETYRSCASPPAAPEVLMRLAAGAPPYRDQAGTPVRRALAALTDSALVRRVERGKYAFVEPMFADWLRRLQM